MLDFTSVLYVGLNQDNWFMVYEECAEGGTFPMWYFLVSIFYSLSGKNTPDCKKDEKFNKNRIHL